MDMQGIDCISIVDNFVEIVKNSRIRGPFFLRSAAYSTGFDEYSFLSVDGPYFLRRPCLPHPLLTLFSKYGRVRE